MHGQVYVLSQHMQFKSHRMLEIRYNYLHFRKIKQKKRDCSNTKSYGGQG